MRWLAALLIAGLILAYAQPGVEPPYVKLPAPIDGNMPGGPKHFDQPQPGTPQHDRIYRPPYVKLPAPIDGNMPGGRIHKPPYAKLPHEIRAKVLAKTLKTVRERILAGDTMAKYMHQHWLRYRKMYAEGDINETEYVEKTKQMLLSLINAALNRLQALRSTGVEVDENLITQLGQLEQELENVQDLNTLRTLYREQIKPLLIQARNTFRFHYCGLVIGIFEGLITRLDTIKQIADNKGIEIPPELIQQMDQIKAEVEQLKSDYENGNINLNTVLQRLRELRQELVEIFKEVRTLWRSSTQ